MVVSSKIMRRYPFVLATLLLSVMYFTLGASFDLDLFEILIDFLYRHEYVEADEVIFFIVLAFIGLAIDQTRRVRRQRALNAVHKGRIQAVRSTMTTVHDIVNNALNNLQIIRLEAESSQALSVQTLETFDDLIADTASQLREISELETFAERTLAPGLTRLVVDEQDDGQPHPQVLSSETAS